MPVFETSRKVQKFGSSLAMTLPAMFVKANEIERGSLVRVYYGLDGVLVMSNCENLEALRDSLMDILETVEKEIDGTPEGH